MGVDGSHILIPYESYIHINPRCQVDDEYVYEYGIMSMIMSWWYEYGIMAYILINPILIPDVKLINEYVYEYGINMGWEYEIYGIRLQR